MPPRGRKRKVGLRREDAARDNMREYGFEERVINVAIKQLVQVYGEDGWKLIEDGGYDALLTICLEKQAEQEKQLAVEQNEEQLAVEQNEEQVAVEQNEEMTVEEQEELAQVEETHDHVLHEQEQHVEDGRDYVGSSNSTSLVRCGAETRTQTCQTDDASITTEVVMDSPEAAFQSRVTSPGYALHSVEGAKSSRCGWLSSEEDTDQDEDSDGEDDEMIQLTPEPLCEELEDLIRKVRGQNTRKRPSRWDN